MVETEAATTNNSEAPMLPPTANGRLLKRMWEGSLARLKQQQEQLQEEKKQQHASKAPPPRPPPPRELRLSSLKLDLACVRYLCHEMTQLQKQIQHEEEASSLTTTTTTTRLTTTTPRPFLFDSLHLASCQFDSSGDDDEAALEYFCDHVIVPFVGQSITLAPAISARSRQKTFGEKQVETLLRRGVSSSSCMESIALHRMNLTPPTRNAPSNSVICATIRDLLTLQHHRLCDLCFHGCTLNQAAAELLRDGIVSSPRGLRTLVLEQCRVVGDDNFVVETLLESLQHQESHTLECLRLSYDSSNLSSSLVRLLTSVLETHTHLKCLEMTMTGGGLTFGGGGNNNNNNNNPTRQDTDELRRALHRHGQLQSLYWPQLLAPGDTMVTYVLRRNYWLWRLGYLCSATTPPLHASVWVKLLQRVGATTTMPQQQQKRDVDGGGPSPIFYFLRHHLPELQEWLQQHQEQQQREPTRLARLCERASSYFA